MASVVRELITKLGFNVDQKALKSAEAGIASIKSAAMGLGVVFAGIGAGLFGLAKSAANAGDEIRKGAQKIGLTTDAYQKLTYAAELSDVSSEQFSMGMGLLSKKLVDAAGGGKETAATFKKLGVSFKDASGKLRAGDSVFLDIADRFQKMPDGVQKTALAMDLFGKSGKEMIPLLNGGSEAIRAASDELEAFNAIIGQDATAKAEEFNDNLTRVGKFISGVKNAIGGALIPIFDDLIKNFIAWAKVNKDLIKTKVKEFAEGLGNALKAMVKIGRYVWKAGEKIVDVFGGIENVMIAVSAAFAIFTGGKIIYGIYTLVTGFWALAGAILGVEAAALIIPALILAAIALVAAAIYYIYDDIQAYIAGQPSMFRPVYDKAVEVIGWLKEKWISFRDFFSNLWLVIKTDLIPVLSALADILIYPFKVQIQWVKSAIGWMGDMIGKLLELLGVADKVGKIWDSVKAGGKFFLDANIASLKGIASSISAPAKMFEESINKRAEEIKSGKAIPLAESSGLGAMQNSINGMSQPPASIGGNTENKTQNNDFQINQKIDVNVENKEAAEIGQEVQKLTKSEMDKSLRQALRALESGAVA